MIKNAEKKNVVTDYQDSALFSPVSSKRTADSCICY